ncbi:PAS domain-containing protein [Allomuricauda sp. F6463D]|uniref:PAS domain-containing protein n=1 Tax=Allomuricauda sp. F6463D TaxID=2926409 RepID=UPI001FF13FE5|nr:PAS domain-containing protein [Muricauda sp. F6463D]MCK0161915.1 PAS domain-containing protein [Muricauda sp. F6463D]
MKSLERVNQFYLLKQLPKATALLCKKGILLDASCSWLGIFSLPPQNETIDTKVFQLYPEISNLKKKLKEQKPFTVHHKIENTRETRHFKSYFAPWFDEKENVIGTIIQTDDITSEVEKEEQLNWLTNVLETKVEVSKTGWWEYSVEKDELLWCKETKRIHQVPDCYEPTTIEAIDFYKIGYCQNKVSMLFHKAIANHQPYDTKVMLVTFTGEERWVRITGKPFVKDGKISKVFGTIKDIHDKEIAETRVKEHQQLLSTLVDSLPLNVYVKDLESRKVLVNKGECNYFSKNADELIGKSDFDLYKDKEAQISRNEDIQVMKHLTPMIGKETVSKLNGKTTYFLTSKIPYFDLEGKVCGLIGMSLDITSLKKKEEQLRNLITVTSRQNQKLISFAHIVSHNLRSHSANFSMLLEFLKAEKDMEERKQIITMLNRASDNLLETMENLNQVVDINTKSPEIKKPIDLKYTISQALYNLSDYLKSNDAQIINNVAENIEVSCVPSYLDSIIGNLISNAVKYKNPDRTPIITINAIKSKEKLLLSISDNGMGIDLNKHGDKIFGMYKTFHKRKGAKGFGLYLIKNQIEAMGGSITVQSEVDKGTTFNVYFNEEN